MTMQIYGEENTLVYRYIYEEAVEVSDENAALRTAPSGILPDITLISSSKMGL